MAVINPVWALFLWCTAFANDFYYAAWGTAVGGLGFFYCCLLFLGHVRAKHPVLRAGYLLIEVILVGWLLACFYCFGPLQLIFSTPIDAVFKYAEHPRLTTVEIVQDSPTSTIDVYAIHGLGSNSQSAWTFRKDKTEVRWLKEILPVIDDFQKARIVMINHQTRWDANAASMTFEEHASKMLRDISDVRESRHQTPIIFVAHSFGGLLLKEMLIQAKIQSNEIVEMTKGILFFGVPHGGVALVWVANLISHTAHWRGSSTSLLSIMIPENQLVQKLERTFYSIYVKSSRRSRTVPPYICDFYEQRSEMLGRLDIGPVVSRSFGYEHGETEHLDADHRGLVKFQSREDPNFVILVRHFRKALGRALEQEELESSSSKIYSRPNNTGEFRVPFIPEYRQNSRLVGRKKILSMIDRHFEYKVDALLPRVVALTGLGGAGKTRIATEYTSQHYKQYESVFWISARNYEAAYIAFKNVGHQIISHYVDQELFNSNYRRLAAVLKRNNPVDMRDTDSLQRKDKDIEINAVKRWFMEEGNNRWLLVFDEIDDLETFDIRDFFPSTSGGNILLTGRRKELSRFGEWIPVGDLPPDEALQLFTSLAGLDDRLVNQDPKNVLKLLEALSHFPLAIVQACAYIRPHYSQLHPAVAIAKYLQLYKTLLQHIPSPSLYDYQEKTVFTTWEVNFRAIEKQDPAAAKILLWAGFLSRQDLLEDIFAIGMRVSRSEVCLQHSFRLLSSYSLIDYESSDAFSMHALVHFWAKERLAFDEQIRIATEAFQSVVLALHTMRNDTSVYRRLSATRRFIPHLNSAVSNVKRFRFPEHSPDLVEEKFQAGSYDDRLTGYLNILFERYLPSVLSIIDKTICSISKTSFLKDLSPAEILESVNSLGPIYIELLLHDENEQICTWTFLSAYSRFPRDDPITIRFAQRLAKAVYLQGRFDEALEWFNNVLQPLEARFGQSHQLTLESMRGKSDALRNQGRYVEALDVLQDALQRAEKISVKDHWEISMIQTSIGKVGEAIDDFDGAINWYLRALSTIVGSSQDNKLGRYLMFNIAQSFQRQNQNEHALAWYQKSLMGFEQALEGDHPRAVGIIYQIIMIYIDHCDTANAIEWCSRIPIFERAPNHVPLISTDKGLQLPLSGITLCRITPQDDPLDWCIRMLQGLEYISTPSHPDTLATYNGIGSLFQKTGQHSTALRWYKETLWRSEIVLGLASPQTLGTIGRIAISYQVSGQPEEALKWFKEELSRRITALGLGDTGIFNTLLGIGSCMVDMGQVNEAREYFRRARAGKEWHLGRHHPDLIPIDRALSELSRSKVSATLAVANADK